MLHILNFRHLHGKPVVISQIKANTKRQKIQPISVLLDIPLDREPGNDKQALNHVSCNKTVSDLLGNDVRKCNSETSLENNVTWYKPSAPSEDKTAPRHTGEVGGSDSKLSSAGCPESNGLSESNDSGRKTMEAVASPGENPDTDVLNREVSALQESVSKIAVATPLKPASQQHTAHQSKSRVDKDSPTPQLTKVPVKDRVSPPALMDISISFDNKEALPRAAQSNFSSADTPNKAVKNIGVSKSGAPPSSAVSVYQAPVQDQRSPPLGARYSGPRIASFHHSQQPGL